MNTKLSLDVENDIPFLKEREDGRMMRVSKIKTREKDIRSGQDEKIVPAQLGKITEMFESGALELSETGTACAIGNERETGVEEKQSTLNQHNNQNSENSSDHDLKIQSAARIEEEKIEKVEEEEEKKNVNPGEKQNIEEVVENTVLSLFREVNENNEESGEQMNLNSTSNRNNNDTGGSIDERSHPIETSSGMELECIMGIESHKRQDESGQIEESKEEHIIETFVSQETKEKGDFGKEEQKSAELPKERAINIYSIFNVVV